MFSGSLGAGGGSGLGYCTGSGSAGEGGDTGSGEGGPGCGSGFYTGLVVTGRFGVGFGLGCSIGSRETGIGSLGN